MPKYELVKKVIPTEGATVTLEVEADELEEAHHEIAMGNCRIVKIKGISFEAPIIKVRGEEAVK